ncbi:hypothetical protein F8388_003456 [Cannabis sativa]|uniref:Uncharacterized protein n=1 Tax=Cannabis sativa TaxID=3483 RepID=A0A7J6F4Z6_CANSA|nr:hypothetical protein F8388_003456 [Cannabis sativa]
MASKSTEGGDRSGSNDKSSWPELVGIQGEIGEKTITKENPSIKTVIIVTEGSFVTMDFRSDRNRSQ